MNQTFDPFQSHVWRLAHGKTLTLGPKSVIMGILNVTPDSFTDGGRFDQLERAVEQADRMREEGALIIDIGGESTRPGSNPVSAEEEQARVMPVIRHLARRGDILLSIDTCRAQTARMAIDAGCHIINDVWGFQKDRELAGVASDTGAGCCIMHTGRERTRQRDVIKDQLAFLEKSLAHVAKAGVDSASIVLDPGFGFAKDPQENIKLLARLAELFQLGYPVMIGASRKRFIGHFTMRDVDQREFGTAATSVVARMKGSAIFRVHDVASNADALAIADAVLENGETNG